MRTILALALVALPAVPAAAGPLDCPVEGVDDRCERWWAAHSGPANGNQFIDEHARDVTFSPDGETLFVAGTKSRPGDVGDDAWLVAYDAGTGALRWEAKHEADGSSAQAVAAAGSLAVITGSVTRAGEMGLLVAAYAGGDLVWETVLGDGAVQGRAIAARNGLLVVGGRRNGPAGGEVLIAGLDAASGELLWSRSAAGTGAGSTGANAVAIDPDGRFAAVTGPRIGEGGPADYDFVTLAVDLTDPDDPGRVRWARTYDNGVRGTDVPFDLALSGDDVLVTGPSQVPGGTLADIEAATIAYDAATGEARWTTRYRAPGLRASTGMHVTPIGERVLVSGVQTGTAHGNDLDVHALALDADTGAALWATSYTGHGYSWEYPFAAAAAGDRLYVSGLSSSNGHGTDFLTLAFDVADGSREWTARLNSSPALVDGDVPAAAAVSPQGDSLAIAGQFTYLGAASALVPAGNDRDFATAVYDL